MLNALRRHVLVRAQDLSATWLNCNIYGARTGGRAERIDPDEPHAGRVVFRLTPHPTPAQTHTHTYPQARTQAHTV